MRRLIAAGCSFAAFASAAPALTAAAEGIHNIQHVVMVMQENRTFDNYFGTYPGANGIPAGVCLPDPTHKTCGRPFHDSKDENVGGPHGTESSELDINGGKMNGFIEVASARQVCGRTRVDCRPCTEQQLTECIDVMGYHDAREIPNYWKYAQNFVLQDNMFASGASWSLPEHLFLVSGWSALCEGTRNPLECVETLSAERPANASYEWTDITYLLNGAGVSWRYFLFEGSEPDCASDESITCTPGSQSPQTPGIWNPLRSFEDVKQDGQLGNIQSLSNYYTDVQQPKTCGLPNVSWVIPNSSVSEHPPGLISKGQAYVTTVINAVMRSPCWNSTAIFLSWDDWGGFYDHVVPPSVSKAGYGIRVPGLVISPYALAGVIDHQQLSHDAFLKFIEDDFLSGARLNPKTDGRPDGRKVVREEVTTLGNIANDFNFNQPPRPPLILSPHPAPGPPSQPPG
ncbi:MAG TPA: alkaline phosphatase family protein [Solirubrobacteraceae bacterium]|jgi:phospholipase C|nr:alkaline phosphatase family protein [Solirubrobacteraceae bacterium]